MLTELQCKQAKPEEKVYSLSDGRGLLLSIYPNGGKYWILRYFAAGKEKRTSLGTFAELSLIEARDKAMNLRKSPLRTLKNPVHSPKQRTNGTKHESYPIRHAHI